VSATFLSFFEGGVIGQPSVGPTAAEVEG
jgi:hypothetical protein